MAKRWQAWGLVLSTLASIALPGCKGSHRDDSIHDTAAEQHYQDMAASTDYQDLPPPSECDAAILSPLALDPNRPPLYRDLALQEAMRIALTNSKVLRDVSGFVLRSPNTMRTVHGPAIVETDPRFGVDAALAAFDATYRTSLYFEKNDRALNNTFFGGGTRLLQQDLAVYQSQLAKRAATGTLYTLRHYTAYDANNAPGNQFPSAWDVNVEAEVRQPLLQGSGVEFNRIAGPNAAPGAANGVLIARVNTDISLADFELSLRDVVSNVENAYWDLYFAYRDLDARIHARDEAQKAWQRVHALFVADKRGGEAEREAEVREQFFRFQEDVQNAWNGRLLDGTTTHNGSGDGTLRTFGGVRVAERRLRLMLGLPINDGLLLRPSDEPPLAKMAFDWNTSLSEAFARRADLRRQRWQIKRRELELIASRNYLLPNLDVIGRYRWRGFGHDLLDPQGNPPGNPFDNAIANLTDGNFQEWQLGLEYSSTIGFRREHAGFRWAQLNLARERSLLCEQEREVIHDLSNAVGDVQRAYDVSHTAFNRRNAAQEQLDAVLAAYQADKATLDLLLDAQNRLVDADIRFHAAMVEYALAIKNVHYEKGSLLDYNEVYLAEGPWPAKADCDARKRLLAGQGELTDYVLNPKTCGQKLAAFVRERSRVAQNAAHPDPNAPTTGDFLRQRSRVADHIAEKYEAGQTPAAFLRERSRLAERAAHSPPHTMDDAAQFLKNRSRVWKHLVPPQTTVIEDPHSFHGPGVGMGLNLVDPLPQFGGARAHTGAPARYILEHEGGLPPYQPGLPYHPVPPYVHVPELPVPRPLPPAGPVLQNQGRAGRPYGMDRSAGMPRSNGAVRPASAVRPAAAITPLPLTGVPTPARSEKPIVRRAGLRERFLHKGDLQTSSQPATRPLPPANAEGGSFVRPASGELSPQPVTRLPVTGR